MIVMAISPAQDNLSARLFVLLSRWSLVTALFVLVSIGFYAAVGFPASDKALGQEYAPLMSAVRSPVLYRLAWASESLYWLMIGGTLIIFAILFARHWQILAAFVAACGIGQLFSSLGAFSLSGFSDIAARYATVAPDQQAALLQSYLNLHRVENAYHWLGRLLQCGGFLLSAWVAWRWRGFPRWLSVWLAIVGLIGLAWFIFIVADPASSTLARPLIFLDVIGLLSVHVAIAATLWRPSATLVAEVAKASATM